MTVGSTNPAKVSPRIWIVNQWLPPDPAPTAMLCGELIEALRPLGLPLRLLSRSRGGSRPKPDQERRVIDHLPHGPTGLVAKLASWPRFAWRAWRCLRRELRPGDLLIVCSDPPLFHPLAIAAARKRGARVVHWSQDLYPEVLDSHLGSSMLHLLLGPLRAWRDRALHLADRCVAISPGMGRRLAVSGASVETIPNWARDDRIAARELGDSELRRRHFAEGDLILAYSGNLGRVHEFDTLLAAARILRARPQIRFLVVGSGPRLPALHAAVQAEGLQSFVFLPLQPEPSIADTLAAGDLHLVSLRPEFEGLVLPSKLYGIAAVGRGMLFCGAPDGEVANWLREASCGSTIAMGDAEAMAALLHRLADDRDELRRLGRNARLALDAQHSRAGRLAQWRSLVMELAGQGRP